jgi:hypothetical protein
LKLLVAIPPVPDFFQNLEYLVKISGSLLGLTI